MFSGIVETTCQVVRTAERSGVLECQVARPSTFDDIRIGDSIAVDGVCLTVEEFDPQILTFALGPETLKVTGWSDENLQNKAVNVERSLRLNDRIHGHLVTGHVDAVATVLGVEPLGETTRVRIATPETLQPYIWSKGSITINGVSLTINATSDEFFEVGLIPETLKRTNLSTLTKGSRVNLEIDNMARGLVHWLRTHGKNL